VSTTQIVRNPSTEQVLAEVPASSAEETREAIRRAKRGFRSWRAMAPGARAALLRAFSALVAEHNEELAHLEVRNAGHTISNARWEANNVAEVIQYYAGSVERLMGYQIPVAGGIDITFKEPVGVVGCVVPWNYPMLITSWKLGPALVTGNSVVLKPAEQSPLTAIRLAELATQAGLPDGVLNVVPGDGPTTGRLLGLHPDVDKLAFTGSTEVGRLFLSYAGQSNMKMVSLECGGKSPHIVLADAPDLQVAADAVAWGIFYNQGESCSAGSRLLVDRSVKDEVVARVVALARTLVVGDPLDPATQVGAVIDGVQQGRVLSYIDGATAAGAEVLIGGSALRQETGGNYMAPTVVDSVTPSMAIAREEVFGPVLAVLDVDGPDEALTVANDTMYGLAAAVWTRDISTAHRMASRLKAGTVWVNTYDATDVALPFGGFKQSGFGRDKSLHAIDGYTQLKTTWVDFSR